MAKSLNLEIPADVVEALRLPEPERTQRLSLELAVSLYAQGILGLRKAARLAGLSRWESGSGPAPGADALRPGGTRGGSAPWPW